LKENQKVLARAGKDLPADRALLNMGLIYADGENPKKDYEKSLLFFNRIITDYPQSPLVQDAKIWIRFLRENEKLKEIIQKYKEGGYRRGRKAERKDEIKKENRLKTPKIYGWRNRGKRLGLPTGILLALFLFALLDYEGLSELQFRYCRHTNQHPILIDPKRLEFQLYEGIPHLLCPVINDPKKAGIILFDAVRKYDVGVFGIKPFAANLAAEQVKATGAFRTDTWWT
jgi:hypothetical protein